jgi:hypothetical protein
VDVFAAVVFVWKGDQGAIGRKRRISFGPDVAGKVVALKNIAVHDPEVAAVTEGDLRFAGPRLLQDRRGMGTPADALALTR